MKCLIEAITLLLVGVMWLGNAKGQDRAVADDYWKALAAHQVGPVPPHMVGTWCIEGLGVERPQYASLLVGSNVLRVATTRVDAYFTISPDGEISGEGIGCFNFALYVYDVRFGGAGVARARVKDAVRRLKLQGTASPDELHFKAIVKPLPVELVTVIGAVGTTPSVSKRSQDVPAKSYQPFVERTRVFNAVGPEGALLLMASADEKNPGDKDRSRVAMIWVARKVAPISVDLGARYAQVAESDGIPGGPEHPGAVALKLVGGLLDDALEAADKELLQITNEHAAAGRIGLAAVSEMLRWKLPDNAAELLVSILATPAPTPVQAVLEAEPILRNAIADWAERLGRSPGFPADVGDWKKSVRPNQQVSSSRAEPETASASPDAVHHAAAQRPDGGGYDAKRAGSGTAREISFGGARILARDADGTYCSGFTFELAMEVAGTRGLLEGKSVEQVRQFQREWYGATDASREKQSVFAIKNLGIGREVSAEQARLGDFVQFWRGDTGHSAIFYGWIAEKGRQVGIRYRSSQQATNGVGVQVKYFSDVPDKKGTVQRDRVYFGRLD